MKFDVAIELSNENMPSVVLTIDEKNLCEIIRENITRLKQEEDCEYLQIGVRKRRGVTTPARKVMKHGKNE